MRNLEVKFFIVLVFTFICFCPANGQEILQKKKTEIQGKGPTGTYTRLIKLFGKNYFTTGRGGHYRVYYGGELYSGAISDTLVKDKRQDQFLFELDSTLEIKDFYVIDNCEEYIDHTNTDKYGVMVVHFDDKEDADSLAVMTLPEGIQLKRSDYLDRSVLIVTDSNFNYIEHAIPTTGKILLLEGGHENLYMTIRIPKGMPYILVGQDTIFNIFQPSAGYQSALILASYDLESKTFNWTKFIGSTYLDYIYDFKMDQEENLILLVNPYTSIELEGEDTIDIGQGPDYNIVLKFSKYGEYLWGENFEESYSEYFYSLNIDDDNSIYLLGSINYDEELLDTFLYVGNWSETPSHGILLKLKSNGEFDWAFQVEGEYRINSFHKFIYNAEVEDIFLSGNLQFGSFKMNGVSYTDAPEYSSAYILKINKTEGKLIGHILSQEGLPVSFPEMAFDEAGNLIAYILLNDRIHFLGEELSPFASFSAGYLLRITSMWNSIVTTHLLSLDLFKVFPNPLRANQKFQLEIEQSYQMSNMHATIFDMQGFVVNSFVVERPKTLLSTFGLMPGAYTLCVYNKGFYKSEIIVIQ